MNTITTTAGVFAETGHWVPTGKYLPALPETKNPDMRGHTTKIKAVKFPSDAEAAIAVGRLMSVPIDICRIVRNRHGRPLHTGKVILVEFVPVGNYDPILPIIWDWSVVRDEQFGSLFAALAQHIISFVEQNPVAKRCPGWRAQTFYREGMWLVRGVVEEADRFDVLTRPERQQFSTWLLAAVTQPYKFTNTAQPTPAQLSKPATRSAPFALRIENGTPAARLADVIEQEDMVGWMSMYGDY